jgi:hypothetical protein
MHTVEPYMPQRSASDAEAAIGKLKNYKSPGVDQIPGNKFEQERKHCVRRFSRLLS